MKQIGLRWPPELVDKVDKAASEAGLTRSAYIRNAVEVMIDTGNVYTAKGEETPPEPTPAVHHKRAYMQMRSGGRRWCAKCEQVVEEDHFG